MRKLGSEVHGRGLLLVAVAASLSLGYATTALAESAPSSSEQSADLQEIVVTAERRSENIQHVPLAVTAVSPAQMQDLNLTTVDSVQFITPGLVFDTGDTYAQNYIRGVGTLYANPGIESPVATYIDGAYQPSSIGTAWDLFDLGSVQVLKGPQGTLYGRNATGGAILIDTADPTHRNSLHVTGEYGRFNAALGEAIANIAVSDTLDLRVGAHVVTQDGYIHNYNGETFGSNTDYIVRGKARWTPFNDFSALLTIEADHRASFPQANATRYGPPSCLACGLPGGEHGVASGFYDVDANVRSPFITGRKAANLKLHYDAGPIAVDSTSSYTDVNSRVLGSDVDGTAADIFRYVASIGNKTYTEDVQASSNFKGWLNFLVGVSYLHDRGHTIAEFQGGTYAGILDQFGTYPVTTNIIPTTSYSGFAELYLTPIDRLRVTLGGRYSHDRRELDGSTNPAANFALTAPGTPAEFSQSEGFGSFTPRFVVAYDADEINYYASFNRGFKAGGLATPVFTTTTFVRPETIDSFEVGAKYALPDSRTHLNLAAFHYNYKNVQVSVTDLGKGITLFANGADARGDGVELDGQTRVQQWLDLNGGVAFLDAHYTKYPNAVVAVATPTGALTGGTEDLTGYPLDRAPRWSGYVGGTINFPVPNNWHARLTTVARYTTRYDFNPGAGGPLGYDYQPSMLLVNMTGAVGPSDTFEVGFYINNLTNKHYFTYRDAGYPWGFQDNVAAPITYGLRISKDFP